MINVQIQKKDLLLLSAIVVFLVGVGYVIAIGENYAVHGHDQDEINLPACGANQVLKYSGGVWGCQNDAQIADTTCATSGTCSQVCIGSDCKNAWEAAVCTWSGVTYTTGSKCTPNDPCASFGSGHQECTCQGDGSWSCGSVGVCPTTCGL